MDSRGKEEDGRKTDSGVHRNKLTSDGSLMNIRYCVEAQQICTIK